MACGGFAFYAWLTSGADYAGLVADDAVYLLMAERFSLGAAQLPVHQYINNVSHFPPLFPLLLAAANISSNDLLAAHWLQCAFIALSALAIGLYALSISKNWGLATFVLAIILASPATLLLSVEIWSEFLFIVLVYVAMAILHRQRTGSIVFIFACLLVGLAAITRGFGLLALAAVLIHTSVKHPRRLFSAMLFGALPLVLSSLAGWGGNRSYVDIFSDKVTDLNTLLSVISTNSFAAWRAWIYLFDRTPDVFSTTICIAVLLFAACGFCYRLRKLKIDSLFCGAYLAMLIIWPFPAVMERLLYPLAPVVLSYALVSIDNLCRNRLAGFTLPEKQNFASFPWPKIGAFILLLIALSSSWQLVKHYQEPIPATMDYLAASRNWMSIRNRESARNRIDNAHGILSGLKQIADVIPEGDCVYSQRPQIVMLYTKRPSFPAPSKKTADSQPRCRFHLLIKDSSLQSGLNAMWPNYTVVFPAKNTEVTDIILARYPDRQNDAPPD